MEQRLKEQERWLAATLRSIADGVITVDTNDCITFMNPVAERLTGWKMAEALGRGLTEVFEVITTETQAETGNSVIKTAREIGCATFGLLGNDGGKIGKRVDLPIVVDSKNTARIQEMHIMIGHIICELVEDHFAEMK